MKGRLLLGLVALPFAGFGTWMAWSVGADLAAAAAMRDWRPVEARVSAGGYRTHTGDDSDTWEAWATYTYDVDGRRYSGGRVQLARGSDNIGRYQQRLGNRLAEAARTGDPMTVYVDPQNPSDAIVDRDVRWGLAGFKSIFFLLFGGIGYGMLYAAFRAKADPDPQAPEYRDAPWRLNTDWQGPAIRSGSRAAMWGAWAFAGLWNLVSAPLPFLLYEEVVENENYLALVGLLFTVIGIGLLVWAIRRTLEWRRFGATPLTLDPFPGAIGGHVGGTVDTAWPVDARQRFRVTLSCVHSYETGSGDDRTRRENVLWQDELVAHTESGPRGTRIVFRFDVPEGLSAADADRSSDGYHLWRASLRAELPGTNLDRDYDIPVYPTGARSASISDSRAGAPARVQSEVFETAARSRFRMTRDGLTKTLIYPMGQQIVGNGAAMLIGGSFAAAGWFIAFHEGSPVFGSVFGGVGALVGLAATWMIGKSLHVTARGDEIRSARRWFGLPVSGKTLSRRNFVRFEKSSNMQTKSGTETINYYMISAVDRDGKKYRLGENFRGEGEARAALAIFERELGLKEREERSRFDLDPALFDSRATGGS